MKNLHFVNISGFGVFRKGAFLGLLNDFRGFHLIDYNFEFNLFWVKDGILDLKYSLVDNWSPVRSNEALYRFKILVKDLALNPKYNLYELLTSSGSRYDRYMETLKLIENSKCIVIDRDPRDIFIASLCNGDNDDIPKDYKTFVKRFRQQRKQVKFNKGEKSRVLRLQFEDLVLSYDETVKKIMLFLELEAQDHIAKKRYFDPGRSLNNVQSWKRFENKKIMDYIRQHLYEYIYLADNENI